MAEKLVCPICGEPTRVYMGNARRDRLCGTHADKLKAGEIALCEDCGKYYNTDQTCSCKKQPKYTELPRTGFTACVKCGTATKGYAFCKTCWGNNSEEELLNILNTETSSLKTEVIPENSNRTIEKNAETIEISDDLTINTCLICKSETNGYLFCKKCFYKYRKKALLLKITNCQDVDILDESYEGIFNCKDGHIVKSKSERDIDNFLFENNIRHTYEKTIYMDDNTPLKPDFYLNDYDVYLEHWGYNEDNKKYTEQKEFKLKFYREKGYTIICTYEKTDAKDIQSVLEHKIKTYKKGIINFEQ